MPAPCRVGPDHLLRSDDQLRIRIKAGRGGQRPAHVLAGLVRHVRLASDRALQHAIRLGVKCANRGLVLVHLGNAGVVITLHQELPPSGLVRILYALKESARDWMPSPACYNRHCGLICSGAITATRCRPRALASSSASAAISPVIPRHAPPAPRHLTGIIVADILSQPRVSIIAQNLRGCTARQFRSGIPLQYLGDRPWLRPRPHAVLPFRSTPPPPPLPPPAAQPASTIRPPPSPHLLLHPPQCLSALAGDRPYHDPTILHAPPGSILFPIPILAGDPEGDCAAQPLPFTVRPDHH